MKALERTTDPTTRRLLPVPYEYILLAEWRRHNLAPLAGGWLDQPHILMMCFRIIDDEAAQAEAERRALAEINRKAVETWNAQGQKSPP